MSLSGARGETVDSQVVVQDLWWLTNVNVSATASPVPTRFYRSVERHAVPRILLVGHGHGQLRRGSITARFWSYPEPLIPFKDPETGAACVLPPLVEGLQSTISSGQINPIGSTFQFSREHRQPRELIPAALGHRGSGSAMFQ